MTTDWKALCAELVDSAEELDDLIEGIRLGNYMPDSFTLQPMRAVMERARAALAQPEPEVYYEFIVLNDEYCTEAGGTAPTLSQALDEGRHYFAQYSQDGQYTLQVHRVEVIHVPQ